MCASDIMEVIWETFLLWGENSAKERIYPTKWKNHTIFCISQKQKQTCLTVTETPVHLKTQLWQTVQTHFLKTPHARKRRKTQVTLNNNNKPALFIQRRGVDISWNLRQTWNFPFPPTFTGFTSRIQSAVSISTWAHRRPRSATVTAHGSRQRGIKPARTPATFQHGSVTHCVCKRRSTDCPRMDGGSLGSEGVNTTNKR